MLADNMQPKVAGDYLVVFAPVHVGTASDSSTVHDVCGLHPLDVSQDLLAVLKAGGTVLILGSLQHMWRGLRLLQLTGAPEHERKRYEHQM